MEDSTKYAVVIKKKIPYVSAFIKGIGIWCLVMAFIIWSLFMPSSRSGNEMHIVILLATISKLDKWVILFSFVGTFTFPFLLQTILKRKSGFLQFNSENLFLIEKQKILIIPIHSINRVEFLDRMDSIKPRAVFEIFIYQNDDLEDLEIKLKEYDKSDELVDTFLKSESLKDKLRTIDEKFFSTFLTD